MAKLGYTWYPKDWGNSESVFELNLTERGLYRELIDLAMMNDNKTELKLDVWCRKFAIDFNDLKAILSKLSKLNLICINENNIFIPSCENRLNLVRGGRKGGKISKPNAKPILKPFVSLDEKNQKPMSNQIEIEKKVNINIQPKVDWDALLLAFNELTKRNFKIIPEKAKRQILARLKEGYSKEDLWNAILNCYNDEYHKETNHKYLTLEFISRPDKMEKYATDVVKSKKQKINIEL
jgi:uncharacterized phage protein (TIGR02220 family)